MTFLCLSTFLSLVFQQDAQSLLGEKRTECSFCSTSEKWSPEPLTSAPLETQLNVTKESLISWDKLNRVWPQLHIDSCHSNFQGIFYPQFHLRVLTVLSSPRVNATHRRGKVPDPKGMSQSGQEQPLHGQDRTCCPWPCCCPVHQLTAADSCTKIPFPLPHIKFSFS